MILHQSQFSTLFPFSLSLPFNRNRNVVTVIIKNLDKGLRRQRYQYKCIEDLFERNVQLSTDDSILSKSVPYRICPAGRSCDESVSHWFTVPSMYLHLHLYQWIDILIWSDWTRKLAIEAYLLGWELPGLGRESREPKWLAKRLRIS